jgi:glycosyltransferase involved in cell wall biosynthesis
VHFIGYVEDDDHPKLLAAADVVVSPSVSPLESTPITLLEAMAQGTAVIGSEVGGTAETVPPGGFNRIVPASDVDELARAMEELGKAANGAPKQPRYPRTWLDVGDDYERLLLKRGGS